MFFYLVYYDVSNLAQKEFMEMIYPKKAESKNKQFKAYERPRIKYKAVTKINIYQQQTLILMLFQILQILIKKLLQSKCAIKKFLIVNFKQLNQSVIKKLITIIMQNNCLTKYSVPITPKTLNETPIYRNQAHQHKLVVTTQDCLKTIKQIAIKFTNTYKQRQCLGTIIKNNTNSQSSIKYITYQQLFKMATKIGSSIIKQQLFQDDTNGLCLIGIFSRNRTQWSVVDIACVLYKVVTVPLYENTTPQFIIEIIKNTQLKTIFTSSQNLKLLQKLSELANLQNIVCFDQVSIEQKLAFQKRGINLLEFKELLKVQTIDFNNKEYHVKPQDCLTFSYTSGSTGHPKASMISHRNLVSLCVGWTIKKELNWNKQDIALSFIPIPYNRQLIYGLLLVGGKVVSYSGNMMNLIDDLKIVKPTVFISIPKLLFSLYTNINQNFNKLKWYKRKIIEKALDSKLENIREKGKYEHFLYDKLFFDKTKQILGGRVRIILSGSTPLPANIKYFLNAVICCPIIQSYGLTQSTGGNIATSRYDFTANHVGGPNPNTQYKLVDVPQMNYTSIDRDIDNKIVPRGQIYLRGPCIFLGYYKQPQKTKEMINEQGWLKTGDIGSISNQNLALTIIDRKDNIFRLKQGVFIAPQRIQYIYLNSPYIKDIFITSNQQQTFSVAIITPNKNQLIRKGLQKNIINSFQQICLNKQVRKQVLMQLIKIGVQNKLQKYQHVLNVYLQPMDFQKIGIIGCTNKIQRRLSKDKFKQGNQQILINQQNDFQYQHHFGQINYIICYINEDTF